MANRVVIDVEARFIDSVTAEAKAASTAVDKIGDEAKKAQKELDKLDKKKAKPEADANTGKLMKKLREAEAKAERLGKTKTTMVLKAVDKASSTIAKVLDKAKQIKDKTWTAAVKVKDSNAAKALSKILDQGRGIAGKTWTAMVKIKDLATTPLQKIKQSLFSIKSLVLAITAGLAAQKFVMQPINLADQYSSAKIGFQTLLGAERGQQMMNDLDKFAKETPFTTSGVIAATQRMVAMGWNAENIITDMKTIGDAAAATGKGTEGLDRIVLALAQIRSKGKLSTEELNQLAEAGISAKRYLAEGLGYGSGDEGIAKLSKDLEKGAIGSEAAIGAILEGMKEYDGMMNRTANETVDGLRSQIEDTFEINIFRRWGQGLQDGAKKGLGAVVELLDTADGALTSFGDMLQETGAVLSGKFATTLENTVKRVKDIVKTEEFQNASLGGKIQMLWEGAIKNPFADWWSSTVVPWWETTAMPWISDKTAGIGKAIGTGLTNGLLALLGVDVVGAANDGASIAGSFVQGFLDGFDGGAITRAFVDAIGNVWEALPAWAKLLIGGYGISKGVGLFNTVAGGIKTFAGNAKMLWGSAGTSMVGGAGISGALASAGYALTGGAAGSALSGGAAAAIGAGGVAGIVAGAASAISGVADIVRGYRKEGLTEDQQRANKVSGGVKLGGVAAGAAIGTMILPGIGTAIGAGLGGVAGWMGGNKIKKNADDAAKSIGKVSNAEYEAKKKAQELAKVDIPKHFGKITLTADEVRTAVDNMIGQEAINKSKAASAAIAQMEESLQMFDAAESSLGKALWMTTTKNGAKLAEEEAEALKNAAANLSESANTYLKDAQYASSESIKAIMGFSDESQTVLDKSTAYYEKQGGELAKLTESLNKTMEEALSDGVISLDEEKSLQTIRDQIAKITRQIQQDEYQADLNVIKAKYGNPDISDETFADMMEQMKKSAQELTDGFWDEFGKGSIGLEEGTKEWNSLLKGTLDQISGVWEDAGDLGLDNLQSRWSDELGILGQDISAILEESTIPEIQSAAETLSDDTRASIGTMIETMKPTTEQIEELANSYRSMGMEIPEALQEYLNTAEFYEALAKGPKAIEEYFNSNPMQLTVTGEAYADIEWTYDRFKNEWISPDGKMTFTTQALVEAGWTYNPFEGKWLSPDESYAFSTDVSVNPSFNVTKKFSPSRTLFGISSQLAYGVGVQVNPTFSATSRLKKTGEYRGGIVGPHGPKGFSEGGMVRGGAQLITVAEEGSPEMIIPLSSQRRERGTKLWRKAGAMLGVKGFARGGLTSGNTDEGLRFSAGATESEPTGGQTVQIEVGGITVEINVSADGTGNVLDSIREQAPEIAEIVAGELFNSFRSQFENTPVRGAV